MPPHEQNEEDFRHLVQDSKMASGGPCTVAVESHCSATNNAHKHRPFRLFFDKRNLNESEMNRQLQFSNKIHKKKKESTRFDLIGAKQNLRAICGEVKANQTFRILLTPSLPLRKHSQGGA